MRLTRLPDGRVLFEVRWDAFVREWRQTDRAHQGVYDGRPAIVRDGDPPALVSLNPAAWEYLKRRLREAMAGAPPKKRERWCEFCRGPLTVAREYHDVWVFRCPQCQSAEVHSKAIV